MPGSLLIDFVPGLGKRTAKLLHRMGVHTVAQLSRIPEGVLEQIFGPSIRAVTRSISSPRSDAMTRQIGGQRPLPAGTPQVADFWLKKIFVAVRLASFL